MIDKVVTLDDKSIRSKGEDEVDGFAICHFAHFAMRHISTKPLSTF